VKVKKSPRSLSDANFGKNGEKGIQKYVFGGGSTKAAGEIQEDLVPKDSKKKRKKVEGTKY